MRGFKYKYEPTQRTFLTHEELEQLEAFRAPNESLGRVKDTFLFSVYSGMRHSDVRALRVENLVQDEQGDFWIEKVIEKTKTQWRVPLLDNAKDIIDKYAREAEITGSLLPSISNQKVNAYLKVIADLAGLDKELTFHVARHTFATTVMLARNIPIELASEFLGHSDIATTQVYARITNEHLKRTAKNLNQQL